MINKHVCAMLVALTTFNVQAANVVGAAAPDFSRSDIAGKPLHLADFRGRVVLLNFWATWCTPCIDEMPKFSAWQKLYGARGLQVIGISMDDELAPVKRFLAKHPVSYDIVLGDAHLAESFGGVLGLPLTYLLDPQGRIVARYEGASDLASIEARVKTLLPR
jgi:cytochrome c biogenesis protein CcmG/thiol:disulfide interchange protein DsbE